MPSIWRKTGGSWVKVKTVYRKTNGSWQSVKRIWRKTGGVWQLVFQQSTTPSIQSQVEITLSTANSTTQTKKLTGTLYRWSNATSVTYNFARGTQIGNYSNISGASGTSTNPASGLSNTDDTYTLTQANMVANATNWFVYISKGINSTFGTEQTSISDPVSFEMPRDINDLTVGTITKNSVALSWTSTLGSNSYNVYYSTDPANVNTLFTTTTSTSTTVTGLTPDTEYWFRVLPYTGSSGNGYYGNYSNQVYAKTPVAPGNLSNVQTFNFSGSNIQLFLTTGTNTTLVNYSFYTNTIPGLVIGPFSQSVSSSRPYKFEHNIMNYFTFKTWNEDTYNSITTYYAGNTAWYAGNNYTAKLQSFSGSGTAPSLSGNNRYWTRGVVVGYYPYTTSNWSSGATYIQGNTVRYGQTVQDAPIYEYTANDPGFSAQTPTNTSYWNKTTTVTYNVGDYIYRVSEATYYFAKSTFNGFYPSNTTYWANSTLGWYFKGTPYNSSVEGNQYDASGSYVTLIRADGQRTDTLHANTNNNGPSWTSLTSQGATANFTPTNANRVFLYLKTGTSGGSPVTNPSGYNPLTINVSPFTSSTATISGLNSNSDYNAYLVARYVYNDLYSVYHDGSQTADTTFRTLVILNPPTSVSVASVSRYSDTETLVTLSHSGGSGPYYQLYWTGVQTLPITPNYDAASNSSSTSISEAFSFGNNITYYFWVRSSTENIATTFTTGTATAGTYSSYSDITPRPFYTFQSPSGATSSISGSSTTGSTLTLSTSNPTTAAPSAEITSIVWRVNDGGTGGNSFTGGSVLQNGGTTFVIPQFLYGSVSSVGYIVRAEVTWNNGVGTQIANSNGTTITAALTKLATPANVNASDDRTDGVLVTWSPVTGAAYYGVWYGGAPSYNSLADFGGNRNTSLIVHPTTSYLDESITQGSTRDYYVQAYRSGDPTNTKSEWGGPNSGTRLVPAPNLTAPSISNVVKSGSNYLVYFSGGSGPYYQIWWNRSPTTSTGYDANGSSSPITVTNLTASSGENIYFYVRSVSALTNTGTGPSTTISSWSGVYTYTEPSATPATAPGTPGTPTNGWTGGTSYPFSWSAPSAGTVTGGGAATITGYTMRIYEATSSAGAGSYIRTTISLGSGTSYTYTSPNAALYYAASVAATNSAGLTGSYSGISLYK